MLTPRRIMQRPNPSDSKAQTNRKFQHRKNQISKHKQIAGMLSFFWFCLWIGFCLEFRFCYLVIWRLLSRRLFITPCLAAERFVEGEREQEVHEIDAQFLRPVEPH